MVIVEFKRVPIEEFVIRPFGDKTAVGVNFGVYKSITEVFDDGFNQTLRQEYKDEMKNHLEIKGFYKFNPEDALDLN